MIAELRFSPLISVITPVFNAARYLPRLFECIRNQHDVAIEHIIVDDCSTDDSLRIMNNLAEHRSSIKIISLQKNSGPLVARNVALREASGKYVAFLDADDFWLPAKCFIQSQFMESTGAAISFSDYRFISEDGMLIGRRLRGPSQIGWSMHHMTRYLGCLTVMINRERCPGFSFPEMEPSVRAEDFLAWSSIISQYGPAQRCKNDLARYAVIPNSRSSNPIRAMRSVWALYRKVERIPLAKAAYLFLIYGAFVSFKRFWCHPRWQSAQIDKAFAKSYLLEKSNRRQ